MPGGDTRRTRHSARKKSRLTHRCQATLGSSRCDRRGRTRRSFRSVASYFFFRVAFFRFFAAFFLVAVFLAAFFRFFLPAFFLVAVFLAAFFLRFGAAFFLADFFLFFLANETSSVHRSAVRSVSVPSIKLGYERVSPLTTKRTSISKMSRLTAQAPHPICRCDSLKDAGADPKNDSTIGCLKSPRDQDGPHNSCEPPRSLLFVRILTNCATRIQPLRKEIFRGAVPLDHSILAIKARERRFVSWLNTQHAMSPQ